MLTARKTDIPNSGDNGIVVIALLGLLTVLVDGLKLPPADAKSMEVVTSFARLSC